MSGIQGPAVFLAQFLRDEAPYDTLDHICEWVASLGYLGVQIPTWDKRVFDLDKAAESKAYCDDLRSTLDKHGLVATELATHLQGQCVAMHPAYAELFQPFYPQGLSRADAHAWATDQLLKAIKASANLGLEAIPTFSGALLWHMMYPWPQRPEGIVHEAFGELAKRWTPIFNAASEADQTLAFELHPGEDLFDGATFDLLLEKVSGHPACCINYDPSHFILQQLDYLAFIDLYADRITAFHVKDAEFNPTGRVGVYGGYLPWQDRAGRFRSLGDGDVDFTAIFTKLTQHGYDGWAVLEWECCVKGPEQGAAEGADFIESMLIEPADVAFDDFAGGSGDSDTNRKILGLS